MIRYFATSGDKHGWAIDEDRRLIQRALRDTARETSIWSADIVHAPFWMVLDTHHPEVLRNKFVIAHADNPPFFYLTQPEFLRAQQQVDLWIARSKEAAKQFSELGLPAEHVPYAIDESLFFPQPERLSLRDKYGISREAYVIGNFHRDSEGSDLAKPKLQKSPETLVAILRMVRGKGLQPHVLLAGPRRHWIRRALQKEAIPFTFVGRNIAGDDFGINILSRRQLNELYNACDLYLVASRWEGGPQSAMEAAASCTKILSYPLGVARDILEPESLFDTPAEAADKIVSDMRAGTLGNSVQRQKEKLLAAHTADSMARGLRRIYEHLPARLEKHAKRGRKLREVGDFLRETRWQLARRMPRCIRRSVRIDHTAGADQFLDEAVTNLEGALAEVGVPRGKAAPHDIVIAGFSGRQSHFRLLPAGGIDANPADSACRIALSVQDAVNFKASGSSAPVLVCPLVAGKKNRERRALLVEEGDYSAALDIWRCLDNGGVVVYPRNSAYYYQAFHAGVPYGEGRPQKEAFKTAVTDLVALGELGRPPSRERAVLFWKTLLSR